MKLHLIPVLLSVALLCTSCAAENTGKVSSHAQLSSSSMPSIASPSSTVDSNQNGVSRSSQGASNINISRSVSSNSNNSIWPSNQKPLSSSEVQTAQNAFSDKLSRIANTKNISKVKLASENMVAGGRIKEYTLDSTDPGTISAWVSLLKQTKVSTAKYAIVFGTRYRVHIVDKIVSYDNSKTILDNTTPQVVSKLNIPPWIVNTVKTGMHDVTEDNGTAAAAFRYFPMAVGGKTGTAEVPGGYNSVFVAFAPFDNPQVAVAAVVEHGYHGNEIAQIAVDAFNAYFFRTSSATGVPNDNALLK